MVPRPTSFGSAALLRITFLLPFLLPFAWAAGDASQQVPSEGTQEAVEAQQGVAQLRPECGFYQYRAVITEVYDGDTVTADIDLGFDIWRRNEKLRLWGIDAPEVRGQEREAGLKVRDDLRERLIGREVTICTIKDRTGKYGRYLVRIFDGPESINLWLEDTGRAEPYEP